VTDNDSNVLVGKNIVLIVKLIYYFGSPYAACCVNMVLEYMGKTPKVIKGHKKKAISCCFHLQPFLSPQQCRKFTNKMDELVISRGLGLPQRSSPFKDYINPK